MEFKENNRRYDDYNGPRFRNEKFSKFQNKEVPVKEGQIYAVSIESVGAKGDGVAKVDGFVVIVPNSKIGDSLKVKINAVRGNVSFADIVTDSVDN